MEKRPKKSELRLTEGGVEAVDRALWILKAFGEQDASLSLMELSTRTGLYKSTILRLLASLESFGYIVRRADKTYSLGFEITRLHGIRLSRFRLEDYVRPVLVALREITSETASLYQKVGNKRVCAYREESHHKLREHIPEGTVFALDETSAGRVLRHYGSNDAVRKAGDLYPKSLPERAVGGRDPDLASIAAPVYDATFALVGALSISGPRTRFDEAKMTRFSSTLVDHAMALSRRLGAQV